MQTCVCGSSVQNSPLVCLISKVAELYQCLHNSPGSQKHQIDMISHTYFPSPITFTPLKAKGNPIQIPGQGAGDVFTLWAPVSFWKHREYLYLYKIIFSTKIICLRCNRYSCLLCLVLLCLPSAISTIE